jgi:hypothetical protein
MLEFPKMIYRPGTPSSQEIWGYRLDTRTVHSMDEQLQAVREGWFAEPKDAIARIEAAERRTAKIQGLRAWYERWEWALKALAVLLTLTASVVALVKLR